ncbi:MAG: hemerythrin domain-containing protein [Rhodospirillaceae bacterium]
MIIEWSEALRTGVESIDDDHQLLLNSYNQIMGYGTDIVDDEYFALAIKQLHFNFSQHCLREENLMAQIKFPECIEHTNCHIAILQRIEEAVNNAVAKHVTKRELFQPVLDWLATHILEHDKRLAIYARQFECSVPAVPGRHES